MKQHQKIIFWSAVIPLICGVIIILSLINRNNLARVDQPVKAPTSQDEALIKKMTVLAQETVSPSIPTSLPLPTLPEGLLLEFYAPRYREANFSTLWISREGGVEIHYFAGNLVEDPDQGVIYVEKDHGRSVEKYQAPSKEGSLKILKFDKNRLYLVAKNGKSVLFDTEKKKFIDEFNNPLPEVTPIPTIAPAYPP
jgi:hypothetical protein